ncbi:Rz1-like lysis system protein LysC [Paraburkholderia edwinii]|uniref:Rz1-like lysis system protein LysC n=1 Tax=Paraburkholderia edwinii TaxID=2861782 RepID=UPI003CCE7077
MQPPQALLQTCKEPGQPSEHTLGGLVQSIHDYQTALDNCNDQLTGLRAFYSEGSK